MTLNCAKLTQSSVIRIIRRNVGLKCFLLILPKYLFVIIVIYAYFIYISQSTVKTHLQYGKIYNNRRPIIANCPRGVPVKEF